MGYLGDVMYVGEQTHTQSSLSCSGIHYEAYFTAYY